jgi:hypothetical protein
MTSVVIGEAGQTVGTTWGDRFGRGHMSKVTVFRCFAGRVRGIFPGRRQTPPCTRPGCLQKACGQDRNCSGHSPDASPTGDYVAAALSGGTKYDQTISLRHLGQSSGLNGFGGSTLVRTRLNPSPSAMISSRIFSMVTPKL